MDELSANLLVALVRGSEQALPRLVGRTFDLKSAYEQFGVDQEHQQTLRIAQKHPEGGVRFFAVQSLPFGATVRCLLSLGWRLQSNFWVQLDCGWFGQTSLMIVLQSAQNNLRKK